MGTGTFSYGSAAINPFSTAFVWPGAKQLYIVADGDSITVGYEAATNYTNVSDALFPTSFGSSNNIATDGQLLANLVTLFSSDVTPLINSAHAAGQLAVCSIFAGTNDLCQNGNPTGAQVWSSTQSYVSEAQSAGADWIIVHSMLPRNGSGATNPGFTTQQLDFNTLLYAGLSGLGANVLLADFCADVSMGSFANLTNTTLYNTDQTHPVTFGQDILGNIQALCIGGIGSRATISGISPNTGTHAGGTSVTITGTGFLGTSLGGVIIGNITAASATVVNDSTITAVTGVAYGTGTTNAGVLTPKGAATLVGGWTWT